MLCVLPNWYEILKKHRISKGLSLRDVEKETGISNSYLSQIENGKMISPSFSLMMKLLNFYRINPLTLCSYKDICVLCNYPIEGGTSYYLNKLGPLHEKCRKSINGE